MRDELWLEFPLRRFALFAESIEDRLVEFLGGCELGIGDGGFGSLLLPGVKLPELEELRRQVWIAWSDS